MADVICPSCNGIFHETTDAYNPDASPNGSMFRLKNQYASNGWAGFVEDTSTIGDNIYCPECSGSYCEGNPARVRVDMAQWKDEQGRKEWPGTTEPETVEPETVEPVKPVARKRRR